MKIEQLLLIKVTESQRSRTGTLNFRFHQNVLALNCHNLKSQRFIKLSLEGQMLPPGQNQDEYFSWKRSDKAPKRFILPPKRLGQVLKSETKSFPIKELLLSRLKISWMNGNESKRKPNMKRMQVSGYCDARMKYRDASDNPRD